MPISEPNKYTTLWSQSGIRFDIPPAADPVTGKAGFDVGFSSINMTSEAAGGIPPWGQDFNGILYSLTRSIQYVQSGGLPTFDPGLSAVVGGYKKGAILGGVNGSTIWQNIVDGNSGNPDDGAAGWVDAVLKILPKRAFSANDFIRIPDVDGGLIVQFGSVVVPNGASDSVIPVVWPIEFPNSAIVAISGISGTASRRANIKINSRLGGEINASNLGTGFDTNASFIAIGF